MCSTFLTDQGVAVGSLKDEEESFFSLENLVYVFFLSKNKCSHSSAKVKLLKMLVQNSI